MKFEPFDIYDFEFSTRDSRLSAPCYRKFTQRIVVLEEQKSGGLHRLKVIKLDTDNKGVVITWLTVFPHQEGVIKKVGHFEIDEALTCDVEAIRRSAKKYFEALMEDSI